MKQFYIVKNGNYTTICNKALRDTNLSLKAKGLYCFMASLPKDWDYTVAGLVAVLKEGREAILNAINELIEYGYLERYKIKDDKGRFCDVAYILYETPREGNSAIVGKPNVGENATKNTIKDSKEIERKKSKRNFHSDKIPHFASERNYTKEELDALIDDIDDISF